MRTQQPFLLLLPLLFLLLSAGVASAQRVLGGYKPIRNVDDPYVREIGQFAVAEYNKQVRGLALVFVRVVSGQSQVVAGTNYKLVVEADGAGGRSKYEAVVYDRPWDKVRTLTSFKPLP